MRTMKGTGQDMITDSVGVIFMGPFLYYRRSQSSISAAHTLGETFTSGSSIKCRTMDGISLKSLI